MQVLLLESTMVQFKLLRLLIEVKDILLVHSNYICSFWYCIATLLSGLTNCDGTEIGEKVQGVQIINPGNDYTNAPGILFFGGGTDGVGAAATVYCFYWFSWYWLPYLMEVQDMQLLQQ